MLRGIGLVAIGLFLAVAGFLAWALLRREAPVAARTPVSPAPPPAPSPSPVPTRPAAPTAVPPLPKDFESTGGLAEPRLAIVLDDLGFEGAPLARIAALEGPVTLAAIPSAPKAEDVASLAKRKGWDLLVHFPMTPETGRSEADAIGPDDADAVITTRVASALDRFPDAVGLNNHQGSRATRDPRVMRAVLAVLKARGLLFLDSRTTPATVGETEARRLSVLALSRDVFLDDAETERAADGGAEETLARAWRRALALSRKRGHAVLIGHPRRETLEFLEREAPLAKDSGVRLVRITDLVDG